jgi:hypothetical protein
MFVAEALDEMMAGTLLADVSEPLYVNTLAPDNDKAVAVDDGVIGPTMFIVAADEHPNPTAPDPPITEPDMLSNVPENDTAAVNPPPKRDPVIIRFPTVCDIAGELAVTDPPVIDPMIIVLPADEANVVPLPPLAPANKSPVIVMVPNDVLFIH